MEQHQKEEQQKMEQYQKEQQQKMEQYQKEQQQNIDALTEAQKGNEANWLADKVSKYGWKNYGVPAGRR
uniref:G-patch domain-containing protein n=1 Tax=Globodera pallida TaxID=36090 RepID=A0A183BTZ1_GLOPA